MFTKLTEAIGFVDQRQKLDILCDCDIRNEHERVLISEPELTKELRWLHTFTIEDAKEVRE